MTAVVTPPVDSPPRRGNAWGLTAFIVGIVAISGSLIPILNNGSIVLGFVGVILAIIGLVLRNRKRGLAITGLILSAISIIAGFTSQAFYGAALNKAGDVISSASASAFDTPHKVVYTVTGDSSDASISWVSDGGSSSDTTTTLPYTKTVTVHGSTYVSVSGTNGSTGSKITCTIAVDGKQVSAQTATGEYASADCSLTIK